MVTNFMEHSPSFVGLAFHNGVEYCNSDFEPFNGDDVAVRG